MDYRFESSDDFLRQRIMIFDLIYENMTNLAKINAKCE